MRAIAMPAYVQAFHSVIRKSTPSRIVNKQLTQRASVLGLVCASISLVIAIFTSGKRLENSVPATQDREEV